MSRTMPYAGRDKRCSWLELNRRVRAGLATPMELRRYAARVRQRRTSDRCADGHDGCVSIPGAPCPRRAVERADEIERRLDE